MSKEFFEAVEAEVVENFRALPLMVLAETPGTLMWDHAGKCQCGRKTYLYGTCEKCMREDRKLHADNESAKFILAPGDPGAGVDPPVANYPEDVFFADPDKGRHPPITDGPGTSSVEEEIGSIWTRVDHGAKAFRR